MDAEGLNSSSGRVVAYAECLGDGRPRRERVTPNPEVDRRDADYPEKTR